VVVTWTDERNGARDVFLGWAESDESSFTSRLIRMDRDTPGAASSEHSRLVNAGGHFHVLWEDSRSSTDVLFRTVFLP
jgi:hypothetical protein